MFTIRVYGILINRRKEILLLNESFKGKQFTKFPGGGLKFGEGTLDCLKREFKEELNVDIQIIKHFYTTDFFQASAFDLKVQVISVYYLVTDTLNSHEIKITHFEDTEAKIHSLEWVALKGFSENNLTFPIDKKVAAMIRNEFNEFH